jgi:hypothetical protein
MPLTGSFDPQDREATLPVVKGDAGDAPIVFAPTKARTSAGSRTVPSEASSPSLARASLRQSCSLLFAQGVAIADVAEGGMILGHVAGDAVPPPAVWSHQ